MHRPLRQAVHGVGVVLIGSAKRRTCGKFRRGVKFCRRNQFPERCRVSAFQAAARELGRWRQGREETGEVSLREEIPPWHRTLRATCRAIARSRGKDGAIGLVLVEGPNDVIRLDTLGVPAVGLYSNRISREQAAKAAQLARELAGGIVTIFLDCDPEGE